jgi:hypothetical protein
MRRYNYNYTVLDTLPPNALTVKAYADARGCNTAYIYKLWREHNDPKKRKPIDFKIILFHDINFVIPE